LAAAGRLDEALQTVDEALRLLEKSQDRWWHAELHRIRGELTLRLPGDHAAAEQAFAEALEVARAQQARSWELRAAISLARLWHDAGKTAEAQKLLGDVHGWFRERFETADLRDAATLLAELEDSRRAPAGHGGKA
jgi:predicted ATPase